jgi:hypothetical protein
MAFIITVDHINNGEYVGYKHAKTEALLDKCTIPFRLYDDDDELYYEGLGSNSSSFQPLDLFGMPNDGCTRLDYFENDKWETL